MATTKKLDIGNIKLHPVLMLKREPIDSSEFEDGHQ